MISAISSNIAYNQQRPYIRVDNPSNSDAQIIAKLRWLDTQGSCYNKFPYQALKLAQDNQRCY